jgi:hypothetical protein
MRKKPAILGIVLGGLLLPSLGGCDAFNPAFLSVLDPTGTGTIPSTSIASGHVVLQVVNKAILDERLLGFLAPLLPLTEAELRALKPRIRLTLQVGFVDGTTQTIEFIVGSRNLIDPAFDAQSFTDLNQNDLDNAVVLCDVAFVQLAPGSSIEVFMPVELLGFELVEVELPGGGLSTTFEQRTRTPPQFRTLQVDEIDDRGEVTTRRNIGIRDVLSPAPNLRCGSVVAVIIDGALTAPFLDGVSTNPSFDIDDEETVNQIGGRFQFRLSIQ